MSRKREDFINITNELESSKASKPLINDPTIKPVLNFSNSSSFTFVKPTSNAVTIKGILTSKASKLKASLWTIPLSSGINAGTRRIKSALHLILILFGE